MMKNLLNRLSRINWVFVLIFIGITSRFLLWLWVSQNPPLLIQSDGASYELLARNLIEGHGYSRSLGEPYAPDMLRTPGYTFFIVGIYSVVGYRPEIVTLLQNFIGIITIYIVYRLALHLFGKKAALIAAAFFAMDVGLIILLNVTMTEAIFLLCFVSCTYCLFASFASVQPWRWMLAAGMLLGVSVLIRPAAIYLIWVLVPLIWWILSCSRRDKVVALLALVLTYSLIQLPWTYRNMQVFGSPRPTLAIQSMTFNMHAAYLRAEINDTTLAIETPFIPEAVKGELGDDYADQIKRDTLIQNKAIAEILQHPVLYTNLYVKSMGLMLLLPNTNLLANMLGILDEPTGIIADMRTRTLSQNSQALLTFAADYLAGSPGQTLFFVALVAELLVLFVTYIFAFGGIIHGLKHEQRQAFVLLLIICAYFFIIVGPVGTGRYRLQITPYLAIFASYGYVQMQAWRQSKISKSSAE